MFLAANWGEGEREEGDEKKVGSLLAWMKDWAPRTEAGVLLCVYCGHTCHKGKREDQEGGPRSGQDSFRVHMLNKHLYARKKQERSCSQCKVCNVVVKGSLQEHMKRYHKAEYKQRLLLCPLCNHYVARLKQHCREEHQDRKWTCDSCTLVHRTYTDPNKFRNHLAMHKRDREKKLPGICMICDNNILYTDLYIHQKTKHQVRMYLCDHCDLTFNFKNLLLRHKQKVEGVQKRKQCPECVNSYLNINDHIKRFHRKYRKIQRCKPPSNLPPIKCKICDQEFKAKGMGLFNPHLREKHIPTMFQELGITKSLDTENGQERDEIGQIFANKKSIWISPDKIECMLCNRSCKNKTAMVAHMRRHLAYSHRMGGIQGTSDSVICPNCGKLQQSTTGAKAHQMSCHKSPPSRLPVECPECGISVLKDYLKKHMGRHTGSPSAPRVLVKCPECGISVTIRCLKEHMRRIHKGSSAAQLLLVKCQDCSMEANIKSLKKHLCGATTIDAAPKVLEVADPVLSVTRKCPNCDMVVTSEELTKHGIVCLITTKNAAAVRKAKVSKAPGPDLPQRVRCPDCELIVTREKSSSHEAVCGSGPGAGLPSRVRCPDCEMVLFRHQLEGHDSVCGFKAETSPKVGTSTSTTPRLYRARGKVTGRTTRSKCPNCDLIILDVDLKEHSLICSKMCNAMCNTMCISLHG